MGLLRWIQVQTQDGRLFLFKLRVRAFAAPVLGFVRFDGPLGQNFQDGGFAVAGGLGQFPYAPTTAPIGWSGASQSHQGNSLFGRDGKRSPTPWLVLESLQSQFQESFAPFVANSEAQPGFACDLLEAQAVRGEKNHPGPKRHALLALP